MTLPLLPLPSRVTLRENEVFPCGANALALLTAHTDSSLKPDGSYRLTVSTDGIHAYAASEAGFFYARQTLIELAAAADGALPCCEIEDSPHYPHRGFMVDCSRHFFTVEELETVIDAAALLKLNVFHWHLSDDQGFRFGSERFPELVKLGSVRPCSDFGSFYEPGEYGGVYTKEEIRRVVASCAERHIEVIPEIDLPGHVSAILAAYPGLSCTGEPVRIKTHGGIFSDVLCAGKERVYEFVCSLLDEVTELFPDEKFHIGGDEVKKEHWRACPDCQKRMAEQGLKTEAELQGYFTRRVAEHLFERGKTPVVWNDALNGAELPPYVCVQYWMGSRKKIASHVKRGGTAVASDCLRYYFDYPYGLTPLNKAYRYDPRGCRIPLNGLKGVECTLWSEFIRSAERLHYLAFPRMAAVAETGWTNPGLKNEADFLNRLKALLPLFEARGIRFAPEADWNMCGTRRIREIRAFARMITPKKEKAAPQEKT